MTSCRVRSRRCARVGAAERSGLAWPVLVRERPPVTQCDAGALEDFDDEELETQPRQQGGSAVQAAAREAAKESDEAMRQADEASAAEVQEFSGVRGSAVRGIAIVPGLRGKRR